MAERYVSIFDDYATITPAQSQGRNFTIRTYSNFPIGKYKIVSSGYFDSEGVNIGTDVVWDYCDNYLHTPMGQLTEIILNVVPDDVPERIPYDGEVFVHSNDMEVSMWCVEGYDYDILRLETYEEETTTDTSETVFPDTVTLVPSDETLQFYNEITTIGMMDTFLLSAILGAFAIYTLFERFK